MHQPRLLFLDAYDSFSNNIKVLLHEELSATVETIRIDDKRFATRDDAFFHDFLQRFDGVVAGPGPGDPRNPDDLGLIGRLWSMPDHLCLPVLGVCLGFQSLALAFDASVEKLSEPRHGLITEVTHRGNSLFQGLGLVKATQYHSLHVRLDEPGRLTASDDLWQPRKSCLSLKPIAWDLSDARNGPVLMGLQHHSKPFWGVQYHPESICTNEAGATIIQNWWSKSLAWSLQRAAARKTDEGPYISASYAFDSDFSDSSVTSGETSGRSSLDYSHAPQTAQSTPAETRESSRVRMEAASRIVSWSSIDMPTKALSATSLLSRLQDIHGNAMMLESGTKDGKPVRPETGRFSIIACFDDSPRSIRYSTSRHILENNLPGSLSVYSHASMQDVWRDVERFMSANRSANGPATVPFWGGLTGFISYEAGLETIDVPPPRVKDSHPDVWFVSVERSVVIDHVDNKVYIQTLHEDDTEWIQKTENTIREVSKSDQSSSCTVVLLPKGNTGSLIPPEITAPFQSEYTDKVRLCQSYTRAGDSYELCLTDQSQIIYSGRKKDQPSAWELYSRLRATNPAPFGAYLHFKGRPVYEEGGVPGEHDEMIGSKDDDITILSSSPERFLSWSRTGKCQFRPIKGTVLKTDDMTRDKAEAILNSDKEQAENLMIVDLIRHDLHGVVGSGNVTVEKLMQVEEYETVFQLVSVIEGQLSSSCADEKTGIDVLAASLPPGSMTGAPKKRSCELLTDIEGGVRGMYSGVMGYFDVGGGGDFSVIIRTAFRWGDEDCWRMGAGGAVTTLSTADGEFDEMMAKRASALRAFEEESAL